ncbi:MAG: hypothetical protein LBV26_07130 [Bacteroidales bacterium]|jgi:hypothetical protein|nr:hypothetical protein [Bacteroidales bacterium]
MEQNTDTEKPVQKIYREKAVAVATALGGPLVAGYILAENFRAFNEPGRVKRTWLWTAAATAVIFGPLLFISESASDKIPNYIIPVITAAIATMLVNRFQKENIAAHTASGGRFFGWWRTVAVSLAGCAVTFGVFLGISFCIGNASMSTKTYGFMNHEIAFDKNNIPEAEVDMLADALTETMFFDDALTKYVFAEKNGNAYEVSIPVVEGIENDSRALQPFFELKYDMQELFPGNKIVFKLVVDDLDNTVKRIE